MKNRLNQIVVGVAVITGLLLVARMGMSEEHSHKEGDEHSKEEGHPENEKHEGEEGEAGHGHEESANVGPEKGITAFSDKLGFKLSPEAMQTFEIRSEKVPSAHEFSFPSSSILSSLDDTGVYRLRDGYFKRVDVKVKKKTQQRTWVESSDLKSGDEVVVHGAPFLRIAEIDVEGGNEGGHHH